MPSKGGRARDVVSNPQPLAAPPVAWSSAQWEAAGFTASAIAQPLRRGLDVERLNDLAGRDDLTTDESDELYRLRLRRVMSRLRQLSRARTRGDEEAIRAALDDLDARLEELHILEAARERAGLASDYDIDVAERRAAIDQLLEIARRRAPGLVAGTDEAVAQPSGNTRVPELAFEATPNDVPVYILAPRSLPSDALVRNVEAVARDGARLRVVHDPSEIASEGDLPPLVLNWGGRDPLPSDLVALNRPDAVRVAADQVESVRRLGELAPKTVLRPEDIHLLGTTHVVAKQRRGARGQGKTVIPADAPWSERARHDLFQQLVERHREFRVSLLNGRVVSAYLKRPPEGSAPDDLRPDWTHERVDVLPRAVLSAAREAARRIGLDYAGVDAVEDSSGRVYCLEANAAPGMSTDTLRSLYTHLQRTLRGRLREAS